jgi:hypothetical protein
MSRILRRPMFRKGGRISSDGVGITSGLDAGLANRHRQNYADGPDDQGVQPSIWSTLQNIYDIINPSAETVLKRLQQRQQEEPEPLIKTQAYRAEQKRIAENYQNQNIPKDDIKSDNIKYNVTDYKSPDYSSNLEKTASSLIPFYQKQLGISPENFDRERYLELAKFGLGLLTPAKAGESTKLLAGISRAGIPSITDLSKINQQEILMDQKIKELALNEAVKRTEPGPIQKAIIDYSSVTGKPLDVAAREYMSRYGPYAKMDEEKRDAISQAIVTSAKVPLGTASKVAEQVQAYNDKQTDLTKKINPSNIKGTLPENPDFNFYKKNQKNWYITPDGSLVQIRGSTPYYYYEIK